MSLKGIFITAGISTIMSVFINIKMLFNSDENIWQSGNLFIFYFNPFDVWCLKLLIMSSLRNIFDLTEHWIYMDKNTNRHQNCVI